MSKLNELVEYMTNHDKVVRVKLIDSLKEFFQTTPEIKFITFQIWSPYFNDGDPCVPDFRTDFVFHTQPFNEEEHARDLDETEGAVTFPNYVKIDQTDIEHQLENVAEYGVTIESVTRCAHVAIAFTELGARFFADMFDEGQYVITADQVEVLDCEPGY